MPTATTSAERMRLTRDRRREGFTSVHVELHQRDIVGLIRSGWLAAAEQRDRNAIAKAMGAVLDVFPQRDGATVWPSAPAGQSR